MSERKEGKEEKVIASSLASLSSSSNAATSSSAALALDADAQINEKDEVALISKEGRPYKLTKKAAMQSMVVKTALENGMKSVNWSECARLVASCTR
jgi:hypothetical protein